MTDSRKPSQPCPYYCCSDFNNFKEKLPDFRADLSNDIHPIFRNITFDSDTFGRKKIVMTKFLMRQPLRLASRFLTMDSASLHILTMVHGDVHIPKENRRANKLRDFIRRGKKATIQDLRRIDHNLQVYPKPSHTITNDHLRRDAEHLLSTLCEMVNIHVSADMPEGRNGECRPNEGPLPEHLSRLFPLGVRSSININAKLIQQLYAAKDVGPCFGARYCQFFLAEVLCHELGHAISHAAYGSRYIEPMKQSAWAGEAGFDFTASILGGDLKQAPVEIPQGPHSNGKRREWILMLNEWPSDLTCLHYLATGSPFGIHTKPCPYSLMTRVPHSFLADMFHDDFWEYKAMHNPSDTLRPAGCPSWVVGMPKDVYRKIIMACLSTSADQEPEIACQNDAVEALGQSTIRMVEYDEEDLAGEFAHRLRDIIRRQWQGGLSRDPADIMDCAARPWSRGEDE